MTQPLQLFWGDIHNHNGVGYGQGRLERSYQLAQNSLDFYAFTPHGWWPDLPDNDPKIRQGHLAGFALVEEQWPEIVARANEANQDGAFTAFVAFEWHSLGWGDYHLLFPDPAGRVFRASNLAELLALARQHKALVVPHHCAYKLGWRGTNWAEHDEELSPVCEIYSEHGNSFEAPSHRGMFGHSMGGSCRSQTVLAQLQAGRIVGFTAGTDNHFGYPGSYGEGLTGLWAAELTRPTILDALRRRHTFAVTGDRIQLRFSLGQGIMGDVLPAASPRELRLEVEALDEIDYIEVNKNGRLFERWAGDAPAAGEEGPRLVRLEWGWDGLGSSHITTWSLQGRVEKGRLVRVTPCLAGGDASAEHLNLVHPVENNRFAVESYTSRRNPLPTNAVVLELEAGPAGRLHLDVAGEHPAGPFRISHSADLRDLHEQDEQVVVMDYFSAPKLRLGPALPKSALHFAAELVDPEPGHRDFYLVKVLQKNGHLAWSSPIWCR